MKSRKLRIAWSVAWGVVAVLLCVLWVRSYWTYDAVYRKGAVSIAVQSADGQLSFYDVTYDPWLTLPGPNGSYHRKSEIQKSRPRTFVGDNFSRLRSFRGIWGTSFVYDGPPGWYTGVPHWFALLMLLFAAVAPWLRWRFSLRTLLIATTLVAVALGLIVWASRANR